MKKIVLSLAITAAFGGITSLAHAQEASEWSFAGNAGLVSDYRFRGFTQTNYKPAFQGGFDLAHASGFYIGNWNSNVEESLYSGASLEMDFYAGYKGTFQDVGYDVGYYYYAYPGTGANGATHYKNGEIYVGTSYGPISAKAWYATTNYFSLKNDSTGKDSKGSYYLELNGAYEVAQGVTVLGHVGWQKIKNGTSLLDRDGFNAKTDNVTDWKIGATKDVSGWLLGLAVVGTNEKDLIATGSPLRDGGKTGVVASVAKTF
ncbi:TorF family putative porin [Derxia gummosa]|uniref:TorF family putative porin n=1 Tax=Derxia gummosa DSM 723 TaxID=1121388 RepID=A0A8B6X4M3_9BURK|nr:TorF family putative porin [Derxia gummosa]